MFRWSSCFNCRASQRSRYSSPKIRSTFLSLRERRRATSKRKATMKQLAPRAKRGKCHQTSRWSTVKELFLRAMLGTYCLVHTPNISQHETKWLSFPVPSPQFWQIFRCELSTFLVEFAHWEVLFLQLCQLLPSLNDMILLCLTVLPLRISWTTKPTLKHCQRAMLCYSQHIPTSDQLSELSGFFTTILENLRMWVVDVFNRACPRRCVGVFTCVTYLNDIILLGLTPSHMLDLYLIRKLWQQILHDCPDWNWQ